MTYSYNNLIIYHEENHRTLTIYANGKCVGYAVKAADARWLVTDPEHTSVDWTDPGLVAITDIIGNVGDIILGRFRRPRWEFSVQ